MKKGNVIIVHGCPGDEERAKDSKRRTYDKHWIPWLRESLEERRFSVNVPLMPKPWAPNYGNWKKEFDKLVINADSILIGHSCGCAFLVRWLGETKKKVKKLILVAPWKIPFRENRIDINFYGFKIDGAIKGRINEIITFTSNDEEDDGKRSVKIYNKSLGGKVIELKNHGHFTEGDMGTIEFPELLEEVLKGR